jgi:hypothetical protein
MINGKVHGSLNSNQEEKYQIKGALFDLKEVNRDGKLI